MGLQLGYLLGGSILIETVFAWPGTGFLLNAAIFQRDLPLLQGTILVLALFFVAAEPARSTSCRSAIDPRIAARLTHVIQSSPHVRTPPADALAVRCAAAPALARLLERRAAPAVARSRWRWWRWPIVAASC